MTTFFSPRTQLIASCLMCAAWMACSPQAGSGDGGDTDSEAQEDGGNPSGDGDASGGDGASPDGGEPNDNNMSADGGQEEEEPPPAGECEQTIALDCSSGTATFDTANGSSEVDGYGDCDPIFEDGYSGKELVFVFTNAEAAKVTVDAQKTAAGSTTYRLNLLDADPCTGAFNCLDYQENTIATSPGAPLEFDVQAGESVYLSYDVRVFDETTELSLAVSCTYAECGDGAVEGDEACDDGNAEAGDGCDGECQIESGYACRDDEGVSDCYEITCGDGRIDAAGSEVCDDGNMQAGDGCSDTCAVESAFTCSGEPSVCTQGSGTCEEPIGLTSQEPLSFSTVGAESTQSMYGPTCSFHDYTGPERVHSIDVPAGQVLRAKVDSPVEFPARVVITDACGTGMGCETLSVSGAASVNRSSETQTKFVIVDGWLQSSEGDYTLSADVLSPAELPAGDVCDTAIELTPPQSVSGDTTGFVNSVTQYGGACGFPNLMFPASRSGAGRDVFYSVRVPAGQTLRAEVSNVNPGVDVILALFDACGDAAGTDCLADVDINSAGGGGEMLTYTNETGSEQQYIVVVDGLSQDAAHTYDFSVSLQ